MNKTVKKLCAIAAVCAATIAAVPLSACSENTDEVVLRVSNWEEYIDLGGWGDDELIEIDNPADPEADGIIGVNSMVDDFTEWFNAGDHGFKVKVEYSTFGTNEDLYNRMNLGDTYDLVCPSDYLIMQLIAEGKAEKFSDEFLNANGQGNYYTQNVSPYIDSIFAENGWKQYAACYMWGTTGLVYNPELTTPEDVSSWSILKNKDYARRCTVKDNVRDAYFAALGICNAETLLSDSITGEKRNALMNATDDHNIAAAEDVLKDVKENVYSFETDSGKADMITGKVAVNLQWSGDGVYILDEAENDENSPTELWYSVPDECTNLWFDGWVMLKDGINGDERRKTAAEAFVNYLSRPDNAVRNMYYIGYTSSIASETTFDYFTYNYGATFDPADEYYDDELEAVYDYDLSYFFGDGHSVYIDASQLEIDGEKYVPQYAQIGLEEGNQKTYAVYSDIEDLNRGRQAFTQYPPESVIERSVIMRDFGDRLPAINQMWINVRCLDVKDFNPAIVWTVVGIALGGAVALTLYKFRYKIFKKS